MTIEFRFAQLRDLDRICALHIESFQGFFLTSLGTHFLRLLYDGFANDPTGVSIVAEDNGVIIGFAIGTTDPNVFFRRLLLRRGFLFFCAAIPGVLRRPLFVSRKCLGALLYRGEKPKDLQKAALLSSLAVAPAYRGQGVGQHLVRAFAKAAKQQNCSSLYLTTDHSYNDSVNNFYAQCGFVLCDTFTQSGNRVMNRWVMTL